MYIIITNSIDFPTNDPSLPLLIKTSNSKLGETFICSFNQLQREDALIYLSFHTIKTLKY